MSDDYDEGEDDAGETTMEQARPLVDMDTAPAEKHPRVPYIDPSYQLKALKFGVILQWFTLGAFVLVMCLLVADQKGDWWTINYLLEGDTSVNGDTYRTVNLATLVFAIGAVPAFILACLNSHRLKNSDRYGYAKTAHMFNALNYGPVALMDAFAALAILQSCGLGHLWTLIYSTVSVFMADVVLCMTRISMVETRTSVQKRSTNSAKASKLKSEGSTMLSVWVFLICKLVPFILSGVAVSAHWPGALPATAFIVYIVWLGIRVLFTSTVLTWRLCSNDTSNADHGAFRWIIMRPAGSKMNDDTDAFRKAVDIINGFGTRPLAVMFIGSLISTLMFVLTMIETQIAFGSGDRGGKNVVERISSVIYTNGGLTQVAQFDRTWPMGQVFVPLQFALPMVMIVPLFLLLWTRMRAPQAMVVVGKGQAAKKYPTRSYNSTLERQWMNARDPGHSGVFAITNGCGVWMLLSITGTHEYTELLSALTLQLVSGMMWAESRKSYSVSYAALATFVCLLPFSHSAMNYARASDHSNIELTAMLVMFIAVGIREISSWLLYLSSETKDTSSHKGCCSNYSHDLHALVNLGEIDAKDAKEGITGYYRSWHPDRVVAWRYAINLLVNFAFVLVIYWLGTMHRGTDINNNF